MMLNYVILFLCSEFYCILLVVQTLNHQAVIVYVKYRHMTLF